MHVLADEERKSVSEDVAVEGRRRESIFTRS